MFSTKVPLQFIMYQHQFSIHRCIANEEHLDTLQIHDEQQQHKSLWCLGHRSVKPKFKKWSRMAAINFENLKVSGIANILVRWLSVEALRPVTRPNAQWHHLFRRPYLGKVEIRKCGTVGPHWNVQLDLMAVFPSSSFQKTNWFCDVLFLSTWNFMFNNLNNRHRRKSTNQTKKTNEPANKQANKHTMRWNSGNCKPKPKLVCHIVMTSPIQVANGVPHDFQGGRSFYSSTMS